MVFSSLIFVYFFLPLNLLVYFLCPNLKVKNVIMLIFSLVFYGCAGPKYVFLLMLMTLVNWLFSLIIEKNKGKKASKAALFFACFLSLFLIGFFKYTGFAFQIFNGITGLNKAIPAIVLPVGISFYTFQLLTYTVDVYRDDVKAEKNYFTVLLYASLFHQCIAGPIVRYKDIADEIKNRKTSIAEIGNGISRFSIGLAKKALLANNCGNILDLVLDNVVENNQLASIQNATVAGAWLGALMFMLQIYLDFSAYSDMAIGMGQMIGFHYKENFDYPYISQSVTEFWRRWHISLGTFFRDYVYIPLWGNRKGKSRAIINMFVVWALTGLWHGASWNFVLWGLYFFVFLVLEKTFLLKFFEKLPNAIGHIYLLVVAYFGWILFRVDDFQGVIESIKTMFGLNGNQMVSAEVTTILLNNIFFIVVCILAVTPIYKSLIEKINNKFRENKALIAVYNVISVCWPVILLILSTMALVGDSYNPFLYFQF